MKKFLLTGLLCILIGITYLYREDIVRAFNKYILKNGTTFTQLNKNIYYRELDFDFVQNTNDFQPKDLRHLYNIYYTAINSGEDKFSFNCDASYSSCVEDVKFLANDQVTLSNINNFVHPYNGFKHIETSYDNSGKVVITIYHTYSSEEIDVVNEKVEEIEKKLRDKSLKTIEQIKVYHDYIVDNAKYDSDRSDKNIIKYKSDTAYGTLIEGYSICGGYADAMAILLTDMGLVNYKISSNNHVWNAVKVGNKWYHLDLTWDDPVTNDGTNLVEHDFFMISTNKLLEIEKKEHDFDKDIYTEITT